MSNPFQGVKFAEYQPTYVGQPVDEFAKTMTVLNQRYDESYAMKDALDGILADIKVDDVNKPHLQNRINAVRDELKDVVATGRFEHANKTIRGAISGLTKDKALKTSMEHYQSREMKKEELRKKYETGYFSKELYDDEIEKLNTYGGIGDPDDLGFYNQYEFNEGAKFVEIEDVIAKGLANYTGGNRNTTQTTDLTYNSVDGAGGMPSLTAQESRLLGMPSISTSRSTAHTDGYEAGAIAQASIVSNPDAMAYLERVAEIRTRKGNPTTVDQLVGEYVDKTIKKFNKTETVTVAEEQAINLSGYLNSQNRGNNQNNDTIPIVNGVPLPAVGADVADIEDLVGSGISRFFSNIWGFSTSALDNSFSASPYGQLASWAGGNDMGGGRTIAAKVTSPFLSKGMRQELAASWQNKPEYIKANIAKLNATDQRRIGEMIQLYGSEADRNAVDAANGDITKMDPLVIARATENIQKNDAVKTAMVRSNIEYTLHDTDIALSNDFIKPGTTYQTFMSQRAAALPIMILGKNGTQGKYYNTGAEWLSENSDLLGKETKDIPIQFSGKVGSDNNLYSVTGNSDFFNSYTFRLPDGTVAVVGIGHTDSRALKPMADKYISMGAQRTAARARIFDGTDNAEWQEQPNPFVASTIGQDHPVMTKAYKVLAGKQAITYYVLHDPVTGVTIGSMPSKDGKYANDQHPITDYEHGMYLLADMNKKKAAMFQYPNLVFHTYGEFIQNDNATFTKNNK